jgi:hypothetical protein
MSLGATTKSSDVTPRQQRSPHPAPRMRKTHQRTLDSGKEQLDLGLLLGECVYDFIHRSSFLSQISRDLPVAIQGLPFTPRTSRNLFVKLSTARFTTAIGIESETHQASRNNCSPFFIPASSTPLFAIGHICSTAFRSGLLASQLNSLLDTLKHPLLNHSFATLARRGLAPSSWKIHLYGPYT